MNKYVVIVLIVIAGISAFLLRPQQQPATQQTETERTTPMMQQQASKQYASPPEMKIDAKKSYTATMMTNKGVLKLNLLPAEAPNTVNNFVFLAREGFYNNTPFHRIMSGFMIQGGDPTGTGTGGPGYRFADEPIKKEYKRGTLAMANAGPNTNGSQFFIMHQDSATLPKAYVIFGEIAATDSESFKTLDTLLATPVTVSMSGERSKPTEEVRIIEVTIEEK
jgi:cyclophilin family peptidyl-prolyl cis-trans isomerase